MRILILCGDYWHPKPGIVDGLTPLFSKNWQVDFITDADQITEATLADYDLVIITKADEIAPDNYQQWKTKTNQLALKAFVENGKGLLVLHAGCVSGQDTALYDELVGCRFKFHPRDTAVTVAPLKPHPITAGIQPFTAVDEHYWIEMLAEDADIIFASASGAQGQAELYEAEPYDNAPATVCPSGYTRNVGKGRVVVLTPGHHLAVWHHPQYQKAIQNAIDWVTFNESK